MSEADVLAVKITDLSDHDLTVIEQKVSEERKARKAATLKLKWVENAKNIKELAKFQPLLLSMLKHDRSSCNDESVDNGLESTGLFRCAKCMLMELLEQSEFTEECEWEVLLDVRIIKS